MRKKLAIGVGLVALVLAALTTGYVLVNPARVPVTVPSGELPNAIEAGSVPVHGQLVGHTEASIVDRFGQPTHRWNGHYGLAPLEYTRKYPGAVTITYLRPAGILYLSFSEQDGQLVCFSSDWMPTGYVF